MKKIDKLILGSFLGPFFLTFFVVIFILLSQFMLKYLDEIVGKDLDTTVILQLIFYFSIFMTPNAFPLAVLLSSLMTFGNLGEHFELTALKGSGISLIRVMVPIFVFTLILTGTAYYSNNYIVPKANLKAFSLLYDVKQMKPSMELKEGSFYNGIEGYSIKVGEKYPDGKTLKDLTIYDHTSRQGNIHVTLADSGQMYNILNDRYLVLEMYDGNTYMEEKRKRRNYVSRIAPEPLIRNKFESQKVVFSLASFDLKRTKEELFSSNRLMKNSVQLKMDVDSMKADYTDKKEEVKEQSFRFFVYHLEDIVSVYKQRALERDARKRAEEEEKERKQQELERAEEEKMESEDRSLVSNDSAGSDGLKNRKVEIEKSVNSSSQPSRNSISYDSIINRTDSSNFKNKLSASLLKKTEGNSDSASTIQDESENNIEVKQVDSASYALSFNENIKKIDSLMNDKKNTKIALSRTLTHVRHVKNNMMMRNGQLEKLKTELNKFQLERNKKLSYAITILIMFFIGAPLGAIIKRGGLGIPVLISLSFFILFYVISMICEKWTRTDVMDPLVAAWMANIILFPVGMFFMKQAKNDARLFETDFYNIVYLKIKTYLFGLKTRFNKKSKSLN